MKKEELRPRQIVREVGRAFPNIWKHVKDFRADKGKALPDWPDWCYMPIAASVAIATGGDGKQLFSSFFGGNGRITPPIIAAAAAWRVSQGIYRFDADLYNALTEQPLDDNLPCDALKRLPEYCVYIEAMPPQEKGEPYIEGFWAHLEYDVNDGREELRFIFFFNTGNWLVVPVHLGNWTLEEGVKKYIQEAKKQAAKLNIKINQDVDNVDDLVPYVQLVIYLCAENADMPKPQHPSARKRMSGAIDAPKKPRVWDVGQRIGFSIRKYRNQETQNTEKAESRKSPDIHASPRPHIRRAHWHHYWTGPREGERKLIVKWLPPIPVGTDYEDESPTVIHPVK